MGSRSSVMTWLLIDLFDARPRNNWSCNNRFFLIMLPFSSIVHCSCMLSGADLPPLICLAVLVVTGRANPCWISLSTSLFNSFG